jgi:DNA-binding MarR family transcriptional regulator
MSTTPPLDADEELLWRSLMRLTITVPRAMSDDLERSSGLNGTEYLVLMHLSEAPGRRLRMSDLADRTALSPSRITRVVDLMASRDLVSKQPCPDDGRSMLAALTRQGLTVLKRAYPHHLQSVRRNIFDTLAGDEVAKLGPVLHRLADTVDAVNPPPPRRSAKRQ